MRAVLVLACLAGAAPAQNALLPPDLARVQKRAVRAERAARFFELWEAASAERRAATERALVALRSDGQPLDGRPGLAELSLATRVLLGASLEEARSDEIARFADALDVRLVPGVATAGRGRGEPLRALVRRMGTVTFDGDLTLGLVWLGPDGGEIRARREPFTARDFASGFTMYLRAPSAEAGTWSLVPEVEVAERAVRGNPVPFEIVPRFAERLARLEERSDGTPGRGRIVRLGRHGVRPADGRRPSVALSEAETTDERPTGTSHPAAALLVVAPHGEAPEAFLHGPVGAAWRSLVAERNLQVATIEAAATGDGGLVAAVAELRRAAGAVPVVLVARADAVTAVHLALVGRAVALDGIVLCGTLKRPGPVLPAVPTLLVSPYAETRPDDPAHLERARGAAMAFLSEPLLPELVGAWLERLRVTPR